MPPTYTIARSMRNSYSSGKIDQVRLEDLKLSEKEIGQIYPVILDENGEIIDGYHRKRVNPEWKEVKLPIRDELESLKYRVHLNLFRRKITEEEKQEWIMKCRKILQQRGFKGTQEEIAKALGVSQQWVAKYDPSPIQPNKPHKVLQRSTLQPEYKYNVWGFKDDSWRSLIVKAEQPRYDFYHGVTPAFIIENLITLYKPRRVLDSMAGVGTTGWVCRKYGIECDQYDIYPFKDGGVMEGDAEKINPGKTYDLIFNHIPYLDMVKYGDNPEDLSNMDEERFYQKLYRIFLKNYELLNDDGVYAVLVGDKRSHGRIIPLTANVTLLGLKAGFILYDEAVKLTGEAESTSGLLQYRSQKFGFMIQCYDTILIFKKAGR